MSHWNYEEAWGDTLSVTDGDDVVCLSVHTPVQAGDLEEGEAVATFNLSPLRARELAQWLVLYADAAQDARADPPGADHAPTAWWNGPPAVPAEPTIADTRKAMEILVCTSARNITELGWYPSDTMDEGLALHIHAQWSAWAKAVLEVRRGAASPPSP